VAGDRRGASVDLRPARTAPRTPWAAAPVVARPRPPGDRPLWAVADALLEGIRNTRNTDRVSVWLGSRDEVLELVANPYSRFLESSLGPAEGYFLSRIDRPMSVQDA